MCSPPLAHRSLPAAALLAALGLVVALGSCCTSRAPANGDPAPPSPVALEPAPAATEGSPGAPDEEPTVAPVAPDCERPPERNCCAAMTPTCERCRDAERREYEAWQACRAGEVAPAPAPEPIDCAAPPVLKPCCRANLPRCYACVADNDARAEAWRAACEP